MLLTRSTRIAGVLLRQCYTQRANIIPHKSFIVQPWQLVPCRSYATLDQSAQPNKPQEAKTIIEKTQETEKKEEDKAQQETEKKSEEQPVIVLPMTPYERFAKRAWRVTGVVVLIVAGVAVSFYYYVDDALKKNALFMDKVQRGMAESNVVIKYAAKSLEKGWPLLYEKTKQIASDDSVSQLLRATLGDIRDPHDIRLLNPNFIQMIVHQFSFFGKDRSKLFGYYRNFGESRVDYYFPIVNTGNGAIALLKISLATNDKLINQLSTSLPSSEEEPQEVNVADSLVLDSVSIVDPAQLVMEYGPDFFESNVSYASQPGNMVYSWPLEKGGEFKLQDARTPNDLVHTILPSVTASPMTTPNLAPVMGYMYVETLPKDVIIS
jgi:hypothetical protein